MSNTIGSTRALDTSRKEALQGLLSSLGKAANSPSSDSTKQVRKLSEKINEILGDGGQPQDDQRDQLLNEDRLPIIDISEPVDGDSESDTSAAFVPEPEFTPLFLLPSDERERRRLERDRILDLLEEEERLQQLQEDRNAEEERKEAIRKRKESAKIELEQLKAAQELRKKMGRALVRNTGVGESQQEEATRLKPLSSSPVTKKSVSFADPPTAEAESRDQQTPTRQPDWGDVTPGRLRAEKRTPLVSAVETQKYPMKMQVVERRLAAPTLPSHNNVADSDDESPSTESPTLRSENYPLDEEEVSSSSNDSLDEEPLEEEFDYDAARHHREIALEYHKKRHTIGAETAKALAAHAPDDYQQKETCQPNRPPPLSRFRADRMAAVYDKSQDPMSTSIEQTITPVSRIRSLQNSVKLGTLENDQLVGGDSGESGSEDEAVREVVHMLQMGSIQNAGPDFKPMSIVQHSDATQSTTGGMSGVTNPPRFKPAHGGGSTARTIFQDNNKDNIQSQPTISNVIERRAPTASPSRHFPISKAPLRPSVKALEPASCMIIDSPSFPMTGSSLSPQQMQPASQHESQRTAPSVEKPISRFMHERKR